MDKLERYRNIIEQALTKHASFFKDSPNIRDRVVFDRRSDSYLIIRDGWENYDRTHGIVVDVELLNGKIWVQEDWLEHGITTDLEEAGVPKEDIVLGFQPPKVRPYTEYAVA